MTTTADHEKKFGGFNDVPPLFREVTEKEFAQSKFFSYPIEKTEYRQMYFSPGFILNNGKNKDMIIAVLFFFFDGTGVAMSHSYWDGQVYYFAFGCDHKYNELPKKGLFNCQHFLKCEKCGHEMITDSSD